MCRQKTETERGRDLQQGVCRVCVFLMSVSVNNPINQVRSEKRREQDGVLWCI